MKLDNNMLDSEKLDKTNTLLVLFLILLISLFTYLYSVEKSINNFTHISNEITELKLLDQELNNFALSMNQFHNHDKINDKIDTFNNILTDLKDNLYKHYPNDKDIHLKLKKLTDEFHLKKDLIEHFKSLNSSLISGSHFLFDLQRNIAQNPTINAETKSLINESLFYIFRFTTSEYIDKAYVQKKLQEITSAAKKENNHLIDNFYLQSKIMLDTLADLKELSTQIEKSPLFNTITSLHTTLNKIYDSNLFIQKAITALFFFSTIIILITLIIIHIRSIQNAKELLAFKYAMQHSDNTIVITDPQRNITFVNDVFEKTTGYSLQEVLGENPRILKSNMQDDSFYKEMNAKLDQGKKWEGEFINKRKDGTLFYEKASIVPVFLNKKLISYLAIKLDITEYVEQNMKLAQAASVFENTEEAIIIADADGKVTSINRAFSEIYGYTIDDIRGRNLSILHSGMQDKTFYKDMWNQIHTNGLWRGKIINRTKTGEKIPVWSTIKMITDVHGKIVNYTSIQTDLREIEDSQAKAAYLAYHDPLTGLYNRVNFEEYLSHALSNAKRANTILAILFIDLDRFKVINDTLGHDIGDEVLITVSSRLKTALRESDFISRWGGDEFVVILENLTSSSDAAMVATNIIETLKQPMKIHTHHLLTTASIGIALYPENGQDASTLIKHADSAMYLAKDMGKNNFRYYTTELSQEIQNKLSIDIALRNAIENNEMYMVFQPQYSLSTKEIVSVEALVRWQNKELGFIPPDKFIPIAEDSGVIVKLGYFIFEESCKKYKEMLESGITTLQRVAINVSSIQFKEQNLLSNFIEILNIYNLKPSQVEIEITEHFLMEHTQTNIHMLKEFQEHGFKISIDDFGTGYSSMSYLKQLPIDTIKIDKSFVDDIAQESSDNVIIEAITALAKTLGFTIVAEGIETYEQEEFLNSIGCDIGQGFLFSPPKTYEEIIKKFSHKGS